MCCKRDNVCIDARGIYLYETNMYADGYQQKTFMLILFDLEHLNQTM